MSLREAREPPRKGGVSLRPLESPALSALSMEPAGLCGRCTGVAVPLRVVPSDTGLPSKRGPGKGILYPY